MKRICILLLMLTLLTPALAEETDPGAGQVCRLVAISESNALPVEGGCAVVLTSSRALLCPLKALPTDGKLYVRGQGGSYVLVEQVVRLQDAGLAAIQLSSPLPIEAAPLAAAAEGTVFRGADEAVSAVYLRPEEIYDLDAALFADPGVSLEPGSGVFTPEGELAGMVLGQMATGEILCVSPEGLYQAAEGYGDIWYSRAYEEDPQIHRVPITSVAPQKGGWIGITYPALEQGYTHQLITAALGNSYYSSYRLAAGSTGARLDLVPGQTYELFLVSAKGTEPGYGDGYYGRRVVAYTVPEAVWSRADCPERSLSLTPDGEDIAQASANQVEQVYFHCRIPSLTGSTAYLLYALTDPEGQVVNEYDLSARIEAGVMDATLQISDLLEQLATFSGVGKLAAGEYRLRVAVNGAWVDEMILVAE